MSLNNKSFSSFFTVRYSETDRMGFLYYGHYASYFEVARVNALKELGVRYRELEDSGFLLPVRNFEVTYKKPAFYDDQLEVRTIIREFNGMRILFYFETYREEELLNSAKVELVFVSKNSLRPCKAPEQIIEKINSAITSK
jgi:acyl-CoA thioester hydrolase